MREARWLVIPYKKGKATTIILHDKDEQAIKELAMKQFEKTGRFSRSEIVRKLIRLGIEALKECNDV